MSIFSLNLEFGDDRCVVARAFEVAGRAVDVAIGAFLGQGGRRPYVIDAKPAISLPGTFAIIPPRELLGIAVHLSEKINETPLLYVKHRCAFRLGKMQLAIPMRNAPDIKLIHCNIEIATQQDVFVRLAGLIEKAPEPLEPIELKRKFIRPKLGAVRDVSVNDAHALDGRGDQTFRRLVVIVIETFLDIFDLVFRKDSDAVVRLLAKECSPVSRIVKGLKREVLINALRLLQANDISLGLLQPSKQLLHPNIN